MKRKPSGKISFEVRNILEGTRAFHSSIVSVYSLTVAFHRVQEFLTILSKVSRGSVEEKLQWIFGLYDLDGDGLISKEEMLDVVGSIYEMLGRYTQPQIVEPHLAAREHVDRIFHVSKCDRSCIYHVYTCIHTYVKIFDDLFVSFYSQLMDANKDGVVTIEELVQWCSKDEQLLRSLDTLDTVL